MSNVHTTVMTALGVHVFRFSPTEMLEPTHLHEVRRYLSELLKTNGTLRVVLDLEQVVLLSSEALALIVSLSNTLGKSIYVAGISAETARVLEVSRLDGIIRMFKTTSEAVEALAA